jgi:hypothetical protein
MKRLVLVLLVLSIAVGQASAQKCETKGVKLLSTTQEVLNMVVNHPDMLVITGKIRDAETKQPITDARINFDKFGDELMCAAIDKDGNYALALNKKEIGEQVRVIFKIEGYEKYIAKAVNSNKPIVDVDLNLWPDDSKSSSTADMKYKLSDDPFGTLVVKF